MLEQMLTRVTRQTGLAAGLTLDPTAPASERWLAQVGLDASAVANDPASALLLALSEVDVSTPGQDALARVAVAN